MRGDLTVDDSYIYCYSFDQQLWQEWEWSERYPEAPEIRSYLEHVTDRFGLAPDIQFSTKVTAATFDEGTGRWTITTDSGGTVTARSGSRPTRRWPAAA
jgi:cyclohexanone monooxygenase